MKMIKTLVAASVLAGALVSAVPAFAATVLYGYNSSGQLFTASTTNATTTPIGSAQGTRVGLAQSSVTGIAYTRSFGTLYSVNLTTGANTTIGNGGSFLTGLAFNAAQTMLYSIDQGSGQLYSVSTSTGAATLIGGSGISGMLDLATNSAGVLYGANIDGSVYTLNTSTGAATLVSRLVTEGLTSIEFDASDNLYGVGLNSDALYRGVLTTPVSVGNFSYGDVRGLVFVSSAVPEPATWGMMILGFGMIGAAARSRRVKTTVTFA